MGCTSKETVISLWPKGAVPNQITNNLEEVHEIDGILRISKVQEPTIEVYLPEKSIATGKAFLIFPGGGYSILAYDWEGTDIAKFLNSHGIAGIVVKYRLPSNETQVDKHNVPLIDAQRAIRLVRSKAKNWNIDPNQIGVIGFSAGGHVASTLGTQYDRKVYKSIDKADDLSARPDFMALIYPVITMGEKTHQGSRDNLLGEQPSSELVVQYSNELNIDENTPRTFMVHAMDDEVVVKENSEYFHGLHNVKAKEKCVLHLYEKGGHGFSLAKDQPYLKDWTQKLINWTNEPQ
ncbi:alpha/beta hydrolase [Maribacter thermophilus]|uniref:alpha/beta hydrolase n=1 Tax=Maribacter thermophilus TaxID=1197874 RepID=UPI000AD6011F|nr:alpha/beta hydrolase [Maribacter thermophilus]